MTVEENLTMPLTMALHDVDQRRAHQGGGRGGEVGLSSDQLRQPVAALSGGSRLRVRLGRALAPDPRILLSEHPNASFELPAMSPVLPTSTRARQAARHNEPCADCGHGVRVAVAHASSHHFSRLQVELKPLSAGGVCSP
jgi:ABC-type lipoprotein export system ATPase subunit